MSNLERGLYLVTILILIAGTLLINGERTSFESQRAALTAQGDQS